MAAKPEDYRVSELLKKGSKEIDKTRDKKTGSIMVRKMDGRNVPNKLSKEDAKQFVKFKKRGKSVSWLKEKRPFVKYGMKPIRDTKNPNSVKYKSDWIDTDEFDTIQEEQERFSGETSGYIEKPKYNEQELQKSLDVKVDELIKKQKPKKGPFILKEKYDKLQARFDSKVGELQEKVVELNEQIAISEELRSIVAQLEISEDSALLQRAAAEDETEVANDRFTKLLSDFQQSLIKGTKEGIERVSLTAQVRGLQAQKATLKELLEVQKGIVSQLESQVSGAAAESAAAASGLTPTAGNEVYFAVVSDQDPGEENGAKWTTARKKAKSSGKAGVIKVKNLRDDGKKITKIKLIQTSGGGIEGKVIGLGNDSSGMKQSVNVNIEQGQEYSEPFYFRKSIGGKNKPKPKSWTNKARDYSGKFKIEIEFEDGTGNVKIEDLTWKVRKNKKG
jgi:hypothetical protein